MKPGKFLCCRFLFAILGVESAQSLAKCNRWLGMFMQLTNRNIAITYRKHPCISRTFFHKIEAKNQGCGLSTETSVVEVLKGLMNIHFTS